jgi:Gas vesicle synthesis protein GvpL/GvpF
VSDGPSPVYVYGVLRAGDTESVSAAGVKGSPVRPVSHSSIAALVSDLEGGALTAAREVRAHWSVLQEASAEATVVPVRFGTVLESDDAVRRQLLEPNEARLDDLLGRLRGRVQLGVKGEYDEERLLREVVRTSPAVRKLRDRVKGLPDAAAYYERIRLGEVVAAEVDRRRAQDSRRALDKLEPLAVAAESEAASGPHGAFNLAFLVDRERIDGFSVAVRELADELGERVAVRYVGPLPPYSFAEAELEARSATWA